MEEMLRGMMRDVEQFHEKVENDLDFNGLLPEERMRWRMDFIEEELNETRMAYAKRDVDGVVDGIVDTIYVAMGMLLEMGVDPQSAFDTVHLANMLKKRGDKATRPGGGGYDAVKPDGWLPPDHRPLLERMNTLKSVSPVFVELTELRRRKGANYNRGSVKRSDHFPLGHVSYFQMVWIKAIRLRSLVESVLEPEHYHAKPEVHRKTNDLIDRELNDLMAYACFWAERNRGLDQEA